MVWNQLNQRLDCLMRLLYAWSVESPASEAKALENILEWWRQKTSLSPQITCGIAGIYTIIKRIPHNSVRRYHFHDLWSQEWFSILDDEMTSLWWTLYTRWTACSLNSGEYPRVPPFFGGGACTLMVPLGIFLTFISVTILRRRFATFFTSVKIDFLECW